MNRTVNNMQKEIEASTAKSIQYFEEYRQMTEIKLKEINDWKKKQKDSEELRSMFEFSLKEKYGTLVNMMNANNKTLTVKFNGNFASKCLGANDTIPKYKSAPEMFDYFDETIANLLNELKGDYGILKKMDKHHIEIFNNNIAIEHMKDHVESKFESIDN